MDVGSAILGIIAAVVGGGLIVIWSIVLIWWMLDPQFIGEVYGMIRTRILAKLHAWADNSEE